MSKAKKKPADFSFLENPLRPANMWKSLKKNFVRGEFSHKTNAVLHFENSRLISALDLDGNDIIEQVRPIKSILRGAGDVPMLRVKACLEEGKLFGIDAYDGKTTYYLKL